MKLLNIIINSLFIVLGFITPTYLFSADSCSPSDRTFTMSPVNTMEQTEKFLIKRGETVSLYIETTTGGTVTISTDSSNAHLAGSLDSCPIGSATGPTVLSYTDNSSPYDGNVVVFASANANQILTITFVPAVGNNDPEANDKSYTTAFETALSGNVMTDAPADSDPDGDTITVLSNTTPSNGSVSVDPNGSFTYTPNTGFTGTDSFIYAISDGNGGTDRAEITITVSSISNNDPEANDKSYTTAFETALSGNVMTDAPADSDPDGDTIIVVSNTTPSNGSVSVDANGSFTYAPNSGTSGTDSFMYAISDGNGGTDTATITITIDSNVTIPNYQNQYSCGVFGSVIVTYDHLYSNGNNDNACNTLNIAYPEGEITGEVICHEDLACNEPGESCTRSNPPNNKYTHSFPNNDLSGSANVPSDPTELNATYYGDISYTSNNARQTIHFDAQTGYNDNDDIKLMMLGDLYVNGGYTLSFEPGDYYFDSITIDGNNNEIILPNGGLVRIFVKGNYNVAMNNLATNTATGSKASDLFIYVDGNVSDLSSGGGTANLKAYFYVKGDVLLNNNSNNWEITGGVTAEGSITINGNNPTFKQDDDAGGFGLGDCILCFEEPIYYTGGRVETEIRNDSGDAITDLNITKAYSVSFTNQGSSIISDNSTFSSYSSSISIDIDNLTHFNQNNTYDGYIYQIGNYAYDQQDTLTDTTDVPFVLEDYNTSNLATLKTLYVGDYMDGDRYYHVMIDSCGWTDYNPLYLTGPFDAWDIYRGDTDNDANSLIDDKNISTKITDKAFDLTIANLDSNGTKLETKSTVNVIEYALYNNNEIIPGSTGSFEANTTASKTHNFTVPTASKEIYVGFKFCSTFDGSTYTLLDDTECQGSGVIRACDDVDPNVARWRVCYSSDGFALRPNQFTMYAPSSEDIELLKSAEPYFFTVYANPYGGADNSGTTDYNQTKTNLDLNKTLVLKDGTVDTGDLLVGNLDFSNSDFSFDNGISLYDGNNEAVGITFDDVGKVKIGLEDRHWADIDSDDTPQDCNGAIFNNGLVDLTVPEGAFICGEQNATFIPDHFAFAYLRLDNNRLSRPFTYLTANNDLNMSATIEVKIEARNATGGITQNFKGGESTTYYENPMTVLLTVPTKDANDEIIDNENGTPLEIVKHDINTSTYLGFTDGNRSIAWNESNASHRIMFNYNKELNNPTNPFDLNMSSPTINIDQVVALNVNSIYPESGTTTAGNTATIVGEGNATGLAKFYYARTRSSKYFYDDVTTSSVLTPIYIDVYCDLGFTACDGFGIDTVNGQINDFNWWLSWNHSKSQGDGDVTLTATSNGAVSGPPKPNIDASGGADKTVTVTHTTTTLPDIVDINFITDTSVANYTDAWLIYNKDSAIGVPSPFYRVRFIGIAGWAGEGDTGHVVGGVSNIRKNKRLER